MIRPQALTTEGSAGEHPSQVGQDTSGVVPGCPVLKLGGSEHSGVLAALLALGDDVRAALAALAQDPGLQEGVRNAVRDCAPHLLDRLERRNPAARDTGT